MPIHEDMTLRDVAELLGKRFSLDRTDTASFDIGLEGTNGEKIAVRVRLDARTIESLDELLRKPPQP